MKNPKTITFVKYSWDEDKHYSIYINGNMVCCNEDPVVSLLQILENLDIEVKVLDPEDIDESYLDGEPLPEKEVEIVERNQ